MTHQHTLRVFDEDLKTLNSELVNLAGQVNQALEQAIEALLTTDSALATSVINSDQQIDALQERISTHTTYTLARQQAVADDLRMILATARIAMHLERIGDYAKNTAKRSQQLNTAIDAEVAAEFRWMGERVAAMLRQVTDAYLRHDAEQANVTWSDDVELDTVYAKLFVHLLTHMNEQRADVADCTQLLFIAKGLERAGDHVTDIAEEVYLMVTGNPLRGTRLKVDEFTVNTVSA